MEWRLFAIGTMDYQDLKHMLDGYANRQLPQRKSWYSTVAQAYDQARPHYPASLIQSVAEITQLCSTSTMLEVGCGPATATVSFASLGSSMVCLEPNPEFTRLAQQNCQSYPNVAIYNTSFEEWPLAAGQFDAVLAATSFHWIPADIAYAKAAKALKDNGYLILLWNKELQPTYEIYQQLARVYQLHAPTLARYEDSLAQEKILQGLGNIMVESGYFQTMASGHVSSEVTYTTSDYLALLTSYSPYIELESCTRRALFNDLQRLIDQQFGGQLQLSYLSAFHIGQKV